MAAPWIHPTGGALEEVDFGAIWLWPVTIHLEIVGWSLGRNDIGHQLWTFSFSRVYYDVFERHVVTSWHTHTHTHWKHHLWISLTSFKNHKQQRALYLIGSRTRFWVNMIIQANVMEITKVEVACNGLHFLHICRSLWDFLLESLACQTTLAYAGA